MPFLLLVGACVEMPKLSFNEPPSAPEVAIMPAAPTTADTLSFVILTEAVDPEGTEVYYGLQWYRNDTAAAFGETVPAASLARGDVWRVEVVASDGDLNGLPGTAEVTVGNINPVLTDVRISPEAPLSADDLNVEVEASDPDGDTLTYRYRWTRDGNPLAEYDDVPTIPAADTVNGEVWGVAVTADDGGGLSETMIDDARIGDTAPTLGSVVLSPSSPRTDGGITATLTGLADADGDAVTVHLDWIRDGVVVASDDQAAIAYYPLDLTKGEVIQVSARAFDGYAEGAEVLSNAVTVVNDPPEILTASLTPDPGYETSTLMCTPGAATDLDGDALTYTYRWVVDGASQTGGSTLDGADFTRGDPVYCAVTPDDGEEEGFEVLSNTISIENSAPTITSVRMSPDPPTRGTGSSAVVSGASDPDGDSPTLSYGWYVNGTARSASVSISGTALTRGDEVLLTVIPSDGTTSGASVSAGPATVANSPPTLSSMSIAPTTVYTDGTLTATAAGFSDADDDPEGLGYQWYKNRIAISGATTDTLTGAEFDRGDQLYCAATPNDGYEDGAVANSNIVTVLNTNPSLAAGVVTAGPYETCDQIQLSAVATDSDSDSVTYAWTLTSQPAASMKDDADIDAATDAEPMFVVDATGTFRFQAAATDGYGTDYQSFDVEVEARATNTDPVARAGSDQSSDVATTCEYSSSYGITCDSCAAVNFSLDATGTTDANGDVLEYEWTVDSDPRVTITDDDTATPTVTVSGVIPSYGFTTTITVTASVLAGDCAEGGDTDDLTLTYTCTGE